MTVGLKTPVPIVLYIKTDTMMITYLNALAFLIMCTLSGTAQTNQCNIRYSYPFDSISIIRHTNQINSGAGYLMLVASQQSLRVDLLSASWLELPNGGKRSISNVDSLLNGLSKDTQEFEYFSIEISRLEEYDSIPICELTRHIFDEDGHYYTPRFYVPVNLIIASLVRRGMEISVSDYDGELYMDVSKMNCW